MTDFGDALIAPTEEPIEDLGGAKATVQAQHNPLAALATLAIEGAPASAMRWYSSTVKGRSVYSSAISLMRAYLGGVTLS